MYVPPAFSVEDRAWALELIAAYPFGILATSGGDFPRITHLPMMAELRDDGELWIVGHIARANGQIADILEGKRATAIFSGPHAYVSASWYERPYETVPTWNYAAVHASGTLRKTGSHRVLEQLAAKFESGRPDPWQLDRLEREYYAEQLREIVAFEFRVERLTAKAKLSQNRTAADRERVIAALCASADPLDRDTADAMERTTE